MKWAAREFVQNIKLLEVFMVGDTKMDKRDARSVICLLCGVAYGARVVGISYDQSLAI